VRKDLAFDPNQRHSTHRYERIQAQLGVITVHPENVFNFERNVSLFVIGVARRSPIWYTSLAEVN
jgi:hypothetical protein